MRKGAGSMRFYVCFWVIHGELTYATSFIDRAKAREWFLKAVEENTHGAFTSIVQAVNEAEAEFDNYVPRLADAESDVAVVKVFQTED
jgi:hypothetical protein